MKKPLFVLILIAGILAACTGQTPDANATDTRTLTVMTHDSFAVSEDVIAQFEAENNVKVEFIRSGDTGGALNKAILSKDNPLADVFYGVDNTFLTRALESGIFESYDSPMLAQVPEEFQLDSSHSALPIDYGDVCINYDKAYFEDNNLAIPTTLEELAQPEYAGLLAVENPSTSSPGLAFLMATIAEFGEDGYLAYWQQLAENDLVVVNDWETAYYTNFSGSSGQGPQPMVVSYGSSPPPRWSTPSPPLKLPPPPPSSAPTLVSARSNSPESSREPRTGIWPRSSSTSCSAPPSRKISPCKCSSSPSTAKRNCPLNSRITSISPRNLQCWQLT